VCATCVDWQHCRKGCALIHHGGEKEGNEEPGCWAMMAKTIKIHRHLEGPYKIG
jgi:hypothetical protein